MLEFGKLIAAVTFPYSYLGNIIDISIFGFTKLSYNNNYRYLAKSYLIFTGHGDTVI